ncbi:glycosyltransferase family 9 protein [Thiotrichales bacterium 19X7-9]|nr:glycosyltransferase family 9 protein [Thiotrichales bacterium 19X7-9]
MSSFKNTILKFVFTILGKLSRTKKITSEKKVLIVSTTGMGDSLWGTPAINYLAKYHQCNIDVLTSTVGIQVLMHNPDINKIYCYWSNSFFALFKLIKTMLFNTYDQVFLFHASQRIVPYIAYLANPKAFYCIDHLSNKVADMYTEIFRISDYPESHQVQWRLNLVEKFYPKSNIEIFQPQLKIFLTDKENEQVDAFCMNHQLEKGNYVFVQPGANGKHKQWSPDNFRQAVIFITQKLNKKVVVSGSKNEIELVETITKGLNENVISIKGEFPVKVVAGIIRNAEFMLTNDTGPMHLGEAFHIPMIVIILKKFYFEAWPILNHAYTKVLMVDHHQYGEYMKQPSLEVVVNELNHYFDNKASVGV